MSYPILIAESLDLITLEAFVKNNKASLHTGDTLTKEEDGIIFHYRPEIASKALSLKEALASHPYQGLIIRPYAVDKDAIAACPTLKLIIRGGAGVNSIDCAYAAQHHITVENTPAQNNIATAEYVMECLLTLLGKRQLRHVDNLVKTAQKEDRLTSLPTPDHFTGSELEGKTLAIIGLGAVGQAVAKRAKAFDMQVIAYSQSFTKNSTDPRTTSLGISQAASLEEALTQADCISLHAPLTDDTHHMLNRHTLAHCKKGAIIINAARPQLIDPEALTDAIHSHQISGFAIDGDIEPLTPFIAIARDVETRNLPVQTITTHHIGDATREALTKITTQILTQVRAFFEQGKTINPVA